MLRENHSGLRSIYSLANKTAIIEGIIVTLSLVAFAPFAPGVLNVTQPDLARWVVIGIQLTALGSTFASTLYLLTSYYLVIEQIALGLVVSLMRDVLLSVALAVGLGKLWGMYGMFVGLAAAPVLAYALLLLYLRKRYKKEDCPLLLSKIPGGGNSYLFNLSTEPVQIIAVQQEVESLLLQHNVDKRSVARATLLIEELYTLIRERNGNKAVLSECSVTVRPDGIQIISKDEGVLFDITEEDVRITSLSAYLIASYLEKMDFGKRHLTTMSFNRSSFLIKPQSP